MTASLRAGAMPALLALGYVLLAWLTINFLWMSEAHISLVWPAAGLALAGVLWGGRRYLAGVWLGAGVINLLVFHNPLWVSAWVATGCAMQALLVGRLVARGVQQPSELSHPQHFLNLCLAAAVGALPSAAWNVLGLSLAGLLSADDWVWACLTWWQGDTLGIILLTPLLLVWRERLSAQPMPLDSRLELILLVGLLMLAGQVVFFGWLQASLGWSMQSYTMLLFVVWAALRFGRQGASLTIVLVAVQALLGMGQLIESLGQIAEPVPMMSYWLYALVLSLLGMSLGLSIDQHRYLQGVASATAAHLQALTASVPGVVYQLTRNPVGEFRFAYVSHRVEQLFGISAQQTLQNPDALTSLIDPEDRSSYRSSIERSAHELTLWVHEYRIQTPGHQVKWVQARAMPERQTDGSLLWNGILTDVTSQRQAQDQLRLAASVFQHTQESILITDSQCCIIDVNQAFCRISGFSRSEVLGQNPRLLASGRQGHEFYARMWMTIHTHGFWAGELWNRHKNGELYAVLLNVTVVRDLRQRVTHYIGLQSEITNLKKHHQRMERNAHFDALTGVPNRLLLADRLAQAMTQARRSQRLLALCYLDLDGFKHINDLHGHHAGDAVLVEVVQRIQHSIRGNDTLARVGGDEFVLLLPGLQHQEEFALTLDRLLSEIAMPIGIPELGLQRRVSASIGVSLFPQLADNASALMEQADWAMYAAKHAGKNCWKLYCADGEGCSSTWPMSESMPL